MNDEGRSAELAIYHLQRTLVEQIYLYKAQPFAR